MVEVRDAARRGTGVGGERWGCAGRCRPLGSLTLRPGVLGFRGIKETSKCIALLRILHVEIF